MTTTLNVPSHVPRNGKPLELPGKSVRHAHGEIKILAGKFVAVATSTGEYTELKMKHLEALFFSLQFNWIRLDSLLRCFKDLPCQCACLNGADVMEYLRYGEEAWDEFYFCSELLVGVRSKAGRTGSSEGAEFLRDLIHLKNFN
jgi:hypothetical protein